MTAAGHVVDANAGDGRSDHDTCAARQDHLARTAAHLDRLVFDSDDIDLALGTGSGRMVAQLFVSCIAYLIGASGDEEAEREYARRRGDDIAAIGEALRVLPAHRARAEHHRTMIATGRGTAANRRRLAELDLLIEPAEQLLHQYRVGAR